MLVAVVPARGGSKGIPRKNVVDLAGRPLLAYTADAALGSGVLDRALLSTDDPTIAAVGADLGLEVPGLRPAALAQDDTPMIDVLQHTLAVLRGEQCEPEALVLLQPTSPLRSAAHIRNAVATFRAENPASLVSVTRVPHRFGPNALMRQVDGALLPLGSDHGPLRRQEKPILFARNGPSVLIVRPAVLDTGRLYGDPTIGFEMREIESLDIDEPEDLQLADFLLRHGWA